MSLTSKDLINGEIYRLVMDSGTTYIFRLVELKPDNGSRATYISQKEGYCSKNIEFNFHTFNNNIKEIITLANNKEALLLIKHELSCGLFLDNNIINKDPNIQELNNLINQSKELYNLK